MSEKISQMMVSFVVVESLSLIWLCDPMNCSMPGFPVLHCLPEFSQTHVHWVSEPWIFSGRTDAEAPILWPPDMKSPLTGKDPDAGKDWRQKKREAKNEMVRQHHQHNGHKSEQTLGDSGGQRSLVCCSPQGHRAGHNSVTEQHNKKSYINTMLTD